MTQLGEQVRAGRTALGLTLAELASRAEIDPGDLSRIENGKIDPRFSTAARLFDALGLRVVPRGTTARSEISESTRRDRRSKSGRLVPVESNPPALHK